MSTRSLLPCILAAGLYTLPALAQSQTQSPGQNQPSSPSQSQNQPSGQSQQSPGAMQPSQGAGASPGSGNLAFMTAPDQSLVGGTGLVGQEVDGANNDTIGHVEDVLVDQNGRIVGLVINVGDYIGSPDSMIGVPMAAIQLKAPGDQPSSTGAVGGGSGSGSQSGQQNMSQNMPGQSGNAPHGILVIVTRPQLQSAPKYHDNAMASPSGSPQ